MGTAREIVNRVQKMRKKAGLQATDPVAVFIDAPHTNGGAFPSVLQLPRVWSAPY
jgi:hypothetical protein